MRVINSAWVFTGVCLWMAVVGSLITGCPANDTGSQGEAGQTAAQLPVADNSELIAAALADPAWPAEGTVKAYA